MISGKAIVMRSNRIAFVIAALMCAASVGAMVLRPSTRVADVAPFSLDKMIPKEFGDWREEVMWRTADNKFRDFSIHDH